MARACCGKPNVKIIKVADFEAGLTGLNLALRNVYISGTVSEEEIQRDLLKWIKEFGNYITPSRVNDYMKALMREYRKYEMRVKSEANSVSQISHKP